MEPDILIKTSPAGGSSDVLLASLFRGILLDLCIAPVRFKILLEKYLVAANVPDNLKEVTSFRRNTRKELLADRMSWKVFIKGLQFLNVVSFTVKLDLQYKSSDITTHSKSFNVSDPSDKMLASMFRGILLDLNVTPVEFTGLLDAYIVKSKVPNNVKEVNSFKNNIRKELLADRVTWKVFIKGLVFLDVQSFHLTIDLIHAINRVTKHHRDISIDVNE